MIKKIAVFLCILSVAGLSYADWYIVSKEGEVLYKAEKLSSKTGMDRRGEIAIVDNLNLSVEDVEYKSGKIQKRKKSVPEQELDAFNEVYWKEESDIWKKIKNDAITAMKAGGYKFKYDHEIE